MVFWWSVVATSARLSRLRVEARSRSRWWKFVVACSCLPVPVAALEQVTSPLYTIFSSPFILKWFRLSIIALWAAVGPICYELLWFVEFVLVRFCVLWLSKKFTLLSELAAPSCMGVLASVLVFRACSFCFFSASLYLVLDMLYLRWGLHNREWYLVLFNVEV